MSVKQDELARERCRAIHAGLTSALNRPPAAEEQERAARFVEETLAQRESLRQVLAGRACVRVAGGVISILPLDPPAWRREPTHYSLWYRLEAAILHGASLEPELYVCDEALEAAQDWASEVISRTFLVELLLDGSVGIDTTAYPPQFPLRAA